jgi:hypothetical protein
VGSNRKTEESSTKVKIFKTGAFGALALAAAVLAACGGGGGGSTPATNPPSGTPTPTPTSSPTHSPSPSPSPSASAAVSGTVVDYAANTPLAGVKVAIAAWTVGAAPTPMATTAANGTFSFSVAPGQYLLYIGSNSPTDTTATLHQSITLTSGANTLTGATPIPAPDVTPIASQTGGALRLMAMNAVQQDCVTGANTGRANNALPLFVPDEYLEEDAIAINAEENAQATDQPTPLFGYPQPYGSPNDLATSSGFSPCDQWTNTYSFTNGNPPYTSMTTVTNIWYGAIIDEIDNPHYGAQLWANDPR